MCQGITEGRALDVIEIDAASNRGIDEIRELRERVGYAPSQARYKVYIIDEVHMLTKEASNALLKTLEEPPPYVIFVLATTEIHKVLPTILSRCQRFDFRRVSQSDIVSKLAHICREEGIDVDPEGLRLMARSVTGSLRDAENLLQQLTTYYGPKIELHQIQAILGVTGDRRVRELAKHIVNNDVSAGIATILSVNSDGLDLEQFSREMVDYLRGLLLIKTGSSEVDLTDEDIAVLKELAVKASLPQILKAVKLFGRLEFGFDNYSTLPLELALVDCVLPALEAKESPVVEVKHEPQEAIKETAAPVTPSQPVATTAEPKPTKARPGPLSAESKPARVPKEPATTVQPGNEVEQLRQNWKRIIEEVPADIKKTTAIAILRSADVRPVAIEGDTIVLTSKYEFYKEQIEKPENQKVAEKIISDFLKRSCRIRCISNPGDNHLLRAALKMGAQVTSVEEK
jgi:DNA polymerase-3 subunit gamma/tau